MTCGAHHLGPNLRHFSTKGTYMILVTGASGRLGRLVIEALLEREHPASEIVAAVRRPESVADLAERGVQVRRADYDEPESWPAALAEVTTVLLIATSQIGARLRHHSTVIDAAANAPTVTRFAYASLLHADTSTYVHADSERALEARIRDTHLQYSMLRYGWFTENYAELVGWALGDGTLRGCAGDGHISGATREDYAAASVTVLLDPDAEEVYELAGDRAFTLTEVAAEMTRQTGQQIHYENLPVSVFEEWMTSSGYPQPVASSLSDADAVAARGESFDDGQQLSQLIGRPTTSLKASIRSALAQTGA